MTDFDLHKSMVHMHVLYQLKTGATDSGQPFITWFWANKASFPGAIDMAVELITTNHVGDSADLTSEQAQDITWEIANRLKIAHVAINKMASPIIVGGAS